MKKRFRLLSLLLAVIFALGCCVACAGEEPSGPVDVPPEPQAPIVLAKDGVSNYVIVYGSTDAGGRNAAKSLQSTLQQRLGALLEVIDDRTAPTEGRPEILVGRTNRGTDYPLQRSLRNSEWIVARDGENLYVLGDGEALLKRACDHLVNAVMDVDFRITANDGEIHRVSGRYSADSVTLNGLPITDYLFLYEERGAADWKEVLSYVSQRVTDLSGYVLTTLPYEEGTTIQGVAMILRSDKTMEKGDYKIEIEGQTTTVTVGTHATALALMGGLLEDMTVDKAKKVTLTVAPTTQNVGDNAIIPLSVGADIRVMTYNVLGNVDKATNYINATVGAYLPDFLCTQEYYASAERDVTTYLASIGYGKIGGTFTCASPTAVEKEDEQYTKVGKYCNTPIFYRTDRWELVESEAYLFYWQNRWPYTDTKSMTYGVFRSKDSGEMVLVIGTHYALMGDAYKEYVDKGYTDKVEGAEWRYQNSVEILKAVDALRQKYPGILTVVGGDLNGARSERGIELLENHRILSDAFLMAPEGAKTAGGSFHGTHGKAPGGNAIDHIFVSEDVADVMLHQILKEQYVLEGSDHCPVIADIARK
ncbi:MAG: endonuclease/exonuclease/phosphatase family protein [Clostridia bacterium]|nr:endonuclease/exonuclease/phosphatase family protein [Clostridia bacterium]